MPDSPSPSSTRELYLLASALRHATLDVVWRQWRALGSGAATTSAAGRPLRSYIDAEALVLVSFGLMTEERRLADLLHDWASVNSRLLSVQRMRNLAAEYAELPESGTAVHLAWFASVARDSGKDLRWRPVADSWPTGRRAEQAPPVRAARKRRVTPARLTSSATLLLRLRLGLGVGVKADLLTYLLGTIEEWSSVRDIVEATAYTTAAVRRAAEDLSTARFIESRDGSPATYRATARAWAALLELDDAPPRWADWQAKYTFVTAFLRWAGRSSERPLSDYAYGAHVRALMERHRASFARDDIVHWSARTQVADWSAFATHAVRALARWMEREA